MLILPVNNKILIKVILEEEKFPGFIIPEEDKKSNKGLIINMSKFSKFLKSDIKEGDKILYNKYCGEDLKIDKKNLIIIKEEDILAILK